MRILYAFTRRPDICAPGPLPLVWSKRGHCSAFAAGGRRIVAHRTAKLRPADADLPRARRNASVRSSTEDLAMLREKSLDYATASAGALARALAERQVSALELFDEA